MNRTLLALAVVAFVVALPRAAYASPKSRLVYSRGAGAESCADETALRKAVAARVGYDPFFVWADSTVVAEIDRRGTQLAARVRLLDAQGISGGVREIVSAELDCHELFDAMALAIAIAIDPQSLVGPAPPPPTAPASVRSAPPSAPDPVAPSAPDLPSSPPPRVPSSRVAIDVGAGVASTIGIAPAPALGGTAFVALTGRRLSLGIELRFDARASRAVAGGGEVGSWLLAGVLAPCVRFSPFFGCALGVGGRVAASAAGVPGATSDAAAVVAIGGRVGSEVSLGDTWVARIRADVLGNVYRATFRLGGVDAWTAPVASATLGLDLLFRFP